MESGVIGKAIKPEVDPKRDYLGNFMNRLT